METIESSSVARDNFFEKVYGTNLESPDSHKEDAVREIMFNHKLGKGEVLLVGDGSTEVRAAVKLGLAFLGIASDEFNGGVCMKKKRSLTTLGANVIIADYKNFLKVWKWLHE